MAIEIVCLKSDNGELLPSSDFDREQLASLTIGKPVKVKITTISERSYQHHKLFFGGLLPLAFQYYEPSGGFVSESEQAIVKGFARRLAKLGGNAEVLQSAAEEYLLSVGKKRAEKFGGSVTKNIKTFRDWLVVEAGYFTLEQTPSGMRKIPQSLSYRVMASQEEFNRFYKDCFGVVWNFVLSQKFKDEAEAQNAVNRLLHMG